MTDQVEVWLDADFLERTRVGTFTHDRGTLRFVYEPEWLKNSQAFALDPDLSLGEGTYFPNAEAGNFRVFDDSAPDRWGQTLMKRREALAAKDESRKPKTLYAWDFLLGVWAVGLHSGRISHAYQLPHVFTGPGIAAAEFAFGVAAGRSPGVFHQ